MADAADEAMAKGPKGEGPVGFRVPSAETQEKETPADEQGAGRRGVEGGAEQPGMPLGQEHARPHQGHHIFTTARRPNSPRGRSSRTTMMRTKGATSARLLSM